MEIIFFIIALVMFLFNKDRWGKTDAQHIKDDWSQYKSKRKGNQ